VTGADPEDLDSFRMRARSWIRAKLRPAAVEVRAIRARATREEELAAVAHDRAIQRMLFDAGLAGVCVPKEYGGQGLTAAHQRVLNEEMRGYEHPVRLQSPTLCQCMAVILEFGTEKQKQRQIPPMLRGESLWAQFLSEPTGGSDVAGARTTAVRDGDEWVLNGSKVWTSGAWWSDWGLCLARTNWDVPKHRGLTVFMVPIHEPGIEVREIEMVNGVKDFCEEFLTDVRVPDADRLGEVDDGWTVGSRWMAYERMGTNSLYATIPAGLPRDGGIAATDVVALARAAGTLGDGRTRDLVGEFEMLGAVSSALDQRVADGVRSGALTDQASAVVRVFAGGVYERLGSIVFELAESAGGVWLDDGGPLANRGADFLMRQVGSIGGGTTEMSRNVVSERVLGMPREPAMDKGIPFRDVPRGRARHHDGTRG
jgi:alkylation response protein AidB-like acyl-CoA dehydrogenase